MTTQAEPGRDGVAKELRRLDSLATPAPWFTLDPPWLPSGTETSILAESPDPHVARFICDFDFWALDDEADADRKSQNPDGDAELMVWLRNNVPLILATLTRADETERLLHRIREQADLATDDMPISAKWISETITAHLGETQP